MWVGCCRACYSFRAKEAEIQRDFYHKGHLYEGAFYGNELVDCILDGDNIDRKQIVNQCRELLEYDILNHGESSQLSFSVCAGVPACEYVCE